MNLMEMIVIVVAIGTIARVIQLRYEAKRGDASLPDADTSRLREEIVSLKDRIAVLERVVTENNRSIELDREIERLRHNDRV